MNNFIKIIFPELFQEQKELLIAQLSDAGFEGFEEGQTYLYAYCDANKYNEAALGRLSSSLSVDFKKEFVEETNWNEQWEQNFQPVQIENFCVIRAHFHPPVSQTKFNIVITPKMSFGTGHHASTFLMIQCMKEIDCYGKTILDFGTGTGVLAILAEKLGAASVLAIDNDEWSIENANENILLNDCSRVIVHKADSLSFAENYDIILANINRNVLLSGMGSLKQHLAKEGVLLMSGLLEDDRAIIEERAIENNLRISRQYYKEGWVALQLTHC